MPKREPRRAWLSPALEEAAMKTGTMQKQIDPSNPVNLDSGQRKELTYIIESLKKNIHMPKKDDREGNNPANNAGGRQHTSRVSWSISPGRHMIVADRNLLAIAERISA
jgi:hypothetical protein